MAFQNVIMPKLKLVHGASKQIVDPVTVIGNGARETRRKQNRYERFVWNFPTRSILNETKTELYSFFRGVNMALDSFLFQDPDFPEFTYTPLINQKSGDSWYFETPTGHPIFNPDMANLVFRVGGVIKTATFAIDANGRPVVTVADSALGGVTVTGPCYLAVRLGAPISWAITAMDKSVTGQTCTPTPSIVDLSDITLVEVFEHA